ncbi:MAG TPA: hypothetical protein VEV84_16170 [Pyrinomonadaceae bacterium]|nr:hypothetical protein [Pyrinomonadaceae bacterium]
MNKISLFLVSLSVLIAAAIFTEGQTPRVVAAIKRIPTKGNSTKDFAPNGWEIYSEAKGDLNGDGLDDVALTLTLPLNVAEKLRDVTGDNYEAAPSIIVILFAVRGGGYTLYGINGRLYPADSDYRSYLDNKIEKGVLVINTNWGDGWANDITYRFRYDKLAGRMMLIGFDHEHYDRASIYEGHKSSENYLTGLRIDYAKSLNRKSSAYSETLRTKLKNAAVPFEEARLTEDPDNDDYRPY